MAALLKVMARGIEADRRERIDAWSRAGRMDKACLGVISYATYRY